MHPLNMVTKPKKQTKNWHFFLNVLKAAGPLTQGAWSLSGETVSNVSWPH